MLGAADASDVGQSGEPPDEGQVLVAGSPGAWCGRRWPVTLVFGDRRNMLRRAKILMRNEPGFMTDESFKHQCLTDTESRDRTLSHRGCGCLGGDLKSSHHRADVSVPVFLIKDLLEKRTGLKMTGVDPKELQRPKV